MKLWQTMITFTLIIIMGVVTSEESNRTDTTTYLRGNDNSSKQMQCGLKQCEAGVTCCNASCGVCSNTGCVKEFCSPPKDKTDYVASEDETDVPTVVAEIEEADAECSNDKDCPDQGELCLDGRCRLQDSLSARQGVQCQEHNDCPQVRCAANTPCPTSFCIDRQCVDEYKCQDNRDCPQVQCITGAVCPTYECLDRRCIDDISGTAAISKRTPSL